MDTRSILKLMATTIAVTLKIAVSPSPIPNRASREEHESGEMLRVTPVGNVLVKGHHTRISVKIVDSKLKVISSRIFRYQ
jgi:hypothetical protein